MSEELKETATQRNRQRLGIGSIKIHNDDGEVTDSLNTDYLKEITRLKEQNAKMVDALEDMIQIIGDSRKATWIDSCSDLEKRAQEALKGVNQ